MLALSKNLSTLNLFLSHLNKPFAKPGIPDSGGYAFQLSLALYMISFNKIRNLMHWLSY